MLSYSDQHYAVFQQCVISLRRHTDAEGTWNCSLALDGAEVDSFVGAPPPKLELRGTITRPSVRGSVALVRILQQRVIPHIELELDGIACPFVVCEPEELDLLHQTYSDYSYVVAEEEGKRLAISDWVSCIDKDPELQFIPNCPHAIWRVGVDLRQLEWHRGAVCARPSDASALAKLQELAEQLGGRLHPRWMPDSGTRQSAATPPAVP